MNSSDSLNADLDVASDQEDFKNAFAIAKQALTFIGTYRTPPTPPIYQLWYHYVEGHDAGLKAELAAIVERRTFDHGRLQAISQEYFPTIDGAELQNRASANLASEIAALQCLLDEQSNAGSDFRRAILTSSSSLQNKTLAAAELQECIDDLLANNAKMHAKLAEMELKLAASQQHIDSMRRELYDSQKAMLTDNLTGIGNRRFFEMIMQQALERVPNDDMLNSIFVLTLVDLDGFKEINDTLGHAIGDDVLRFTAQEIQRLAGDGSVARLGGDEFGVLHCIANQDPIDGLAHAIRDFFSQKKLLLQPCGTQVYNLTLSVGVALLREDDDRASWFERADKLMYASKKAGKNCVMSERSLLP